ncbi:M23 family metallopeptidase [Hydrogenothermus marinus]|uniref:Murein DD-endopeptidase MepM/ murein hydrolase activator NlpD n=1 Tax=Hydrogenothermus marinus TaxID=133270 RepID=A0A3M0BEC1_9AQUI|nr:M23 family metallopeptidase [Hydrogenothermus marinus]RMA93338.1 murein DD-endopeptidase MepM/ murein hydrolase activator NlpD [Hydrogenothermus marinus]
MRLGINILTILFFTFSVAFAKVYIVKPGDNLHYIAKKYKVSVDEIIKINHLRKPYIIRPGQKIKIPVKQKKKTEQQSINNCAITYKVKAGDSLITIAKKYHVWVKDLKKLNNLKGNTIRVGQILCIKKGNKNYHQTKKTKKSPKVKVKKKIIKKIVIHTVKPGESIALIARKYNASVNEIIKINHLRKPYIIRPGQKIKIPKKIVKVVEITEEEKIKQISKSMPFGFIWPVDKGVVIAQFVNSSTLRHLGIDIKTDCNYPIKASESGKVIYAGDSIKAFGNLVIIKHRKNYNTVYGHIGKIATKDGKYVKKGDIIGYTGKLNNSDDCGLYFEIRKNAIPVDPIVLLPKKKEVQTK